MGASFVHALFFLSVVCVVSAETLWPMPSSLTVGSTTLGVDPSAFSVSSNITSSVLSAAIARYFNSSNPTAPSLLFPFTGVSAPTTSSTVSSLSIGVGTSDETLQLGVDESYTLTVPSDSSKNVATITAATIYGAMRGLESFSQLVDFDVGAMTYAVSVAPVSVSDAPRFKWRGLLIDSARHYLSIDAILRTIDALSYSKFNTLHWHVVDAESFPMEIDSYPLLAEKGAYSASAMYDSSDVSNVVQYAQERGIRVVVEFDMPGHAYSWGKGYSNLTTSCPSYESNINNIPLDPTQHFTYDVILGVLTEMAKVVPDDYMHIGGDEVITGCWLENPNITSWMMQHGITTGTELLQFFETNMLSVMQAVQRKSVVWEDLFDASIGLANDTIVEVWDGATSLESIVKAGYQCITAWGWYLNNQVPIPGQEVGQWVDTWQTFYGNDPTAGLGLSSSEEALVLGGEAAMWGEQVDSINIDSRVWPRACGVAERLWSPSSVNDVTSASPRLQEHRCRLAQRGIGAGPIVPDYCVLPTDVQAMKERKKRKAARSDL